MRSPAELAVTIPRRWAWALGIGIALLAALLGWLLVAGRTAAPLVVDTVRSAVAAAQARVMGPVPLRVTTVPPPSTADAKAAHGDDEYEVCGGTWVKANADGSVDDKLLNGPMRRDEAAQAVDRGLAADARPVAQAARLVLQTMGGDDDRRRALAANTAGCGPECPQAASVPAAAFDAVAAGREALARLAVTTTDPAAYALAFRMCGSGRLRSGSCGLLSAEQWARLDPGNAAPWQDVLAAAQSRKDNAAANEALHRIATSQRSDQRFFDLPGLFIDAAPDEDGLRNGVFMLALEAIGLQSAWAIPGSQPLTTACRREQLRDSNRRQTCEAIAELLAEKSDTLIERSIGGAIGRQAGWPEARIERMRAEQSAFTDSMFAGMEMRDAMSCAGIKRLTDDVHRKARLGEVGAMRDWLAHEAPPPDELLRRYRAEQRESAERSKAIATAPAASGASAPG